MVDLFIGCILTRPKNLFPDGKIVSLLSGEVFFDAPAIGNPKIVDAIGQVFPDVDLPIWVCDLVDYFHRLTRMIISFIRASDITNPKTKKAPSKGLRGRGG